ncbi:hypothetical protein DRE_00159 [Drechslerella stenobrocha 248]|uniref:Aldehyde dehydrogenase n=1 Tax=Drechslerella stenobrocha 248 TaxID=1043628 RepID=W7HZA6_9PEZI|nr:hypothetical protein DRE_00159 [Drechslerella stenobrocha 248]
MSNAKPDGIAAPTATPVDDIPAIVGRMRTTFRSHATRPVEWRRQQLRKLWWGFHDHEKNITAALAQDIHKAELEALQSDGVWLKNAIIDVLADLDKWTQEEKLSVDLMSMAASPVIRKEPLGVVLIIGAYNYPFQLTFGPMIGAIAAGNCVVVKPSEVSTASATVVTNIITERLDPDAFAVINGSIPETTKLLEQKFDKICYTGSTAVGRVVAAAAAKHLTPTILELGGLNPCIISKSADAKLAARRVSWGKTLNGGQVCISPNYAIVHSSKEAEFVDSMANTLHKFYPNGMQASPDLARIVNDRHFHRIKNMLDQTSGEIKIGGRTDENDKYIDVTLVKVKDENDSLMKDEIFGPVLPYLVIDNLDDQVEFVNRISDSPLALYLFTNDKKEEEYILSRTRSGGVSVNDCIWHAASHKVPFGGIGDSGMGNYRDKFGFDQFSHHRTTARQAGGWFEAILDARYPPYLPSKLSQYRFLLEKKPNFSRDGKARVSAFGWLGWLLKLGGGSSKAVILKYALTIVGAVYLRNQLEAKRQLV